MLTELAGKGGDVAITSVELPEQFLFRGGTFGDGRARTLGRRRERARPSGCRRALIAAVAGEGVSGQRPELRVAVQRVRAFAQEPGHRVGQVGVVDRRAMLLPDGLRNVEQLAHVARPRVDQERLERLGRQRGVIGKPCMFAEQADDVGPALSKRRQPQRVGGEAEVEVLAERAGVNRRFDGEVGCGEHAHVDLPRRGRADASDEAVFERGEQFGLKLGRQLADLVEEQRAAVGDLDQACFRRRSARERAALVAKELRLHEVAWQGGAVDVDPRLRARRARRDPVREVSFARPGGAQDEDGGLRTLKPRDLALEHHLVDRVARDVVVDAGANLHEHQRVAHAEHRARLEHRVRDANAVDEGPVRRTEVLEVPTAGVLSPTQANMIARGTPVVEHEIVRVAAPDRDRRTAQRDDMRRARRGVHEQARERRAFASQLARGHRIGRDHQTGARGIGPNYATPDLGQEANAVTHRHRSHRTSHTRSHTLMGCVMRKSS